VALALTSFDNSAVHYVLYILWMMSCLPILGFLAQFVFLNGERTA